MKESEFSVSHLLEKRFKKIFIDHGIQDKTLLLALSGGFDSMLLLHLISQIKNALSLRVYAAYVHHGKEKTLQGEYRNLAWLKVKEETSKKKIKSFFHLYTGEGRENKNSKKASFKEDLAVRNSFSDSAPLKEAFYRKIRYLILRERKKDLKADFIVLAHFLNDLLETRLIRLIRGTGRRGLRSMSVKEGDLLRPLLPFQREEFLDYEQGDYPLSYVKDPSNQNLNVLRNWIRVKVLPDLEKIRPGSFKSLFRSLENLCEGEENLWDPDVYFVTKNALSFPLFMELNQEQKMSLLFYYMRKMCMKNYSLSHVREILKRLKGSRTKMQFRLLKHNWIVNQESIKAQSLNESSIKSFI